MPVPALRAPMNTRIAENGPTQPPTVTGRGWRPHLYALVGVAALFLTGSGLSVWMAHRLSVQAQAEAGARLEAQANLLEDAVLTKFDKPLQALKGLAAAFTLDPGLSKKQFRDYWAVRGFQRDFPGVRGFGYIAHVAPGQIDAFLAATRRDLGGEFQIKTLGPTAERYIIKLVEPVEDNLNAVGLDIGSEPVRRLAADESLRSGLPMLTGAIHLVQDGRQGPGFLLLVPVYRNGSSPDSEASRRAHHLGFAYSPLVAEELLKPLLLQAQGQVHFDLEVRSPQQQARSVFQSERLTATGRIDASSPPAGRPRFDTNRHFLFAGMEFRLHVYGNKAFDAGVDAAQSASIWRVGVGGIAFSAVLSLVLWLLLSGRARAEVRARELTREMRQLALVAEHTSNAVMIADASQRIVWVNRAYTTLWGYSFADVRGGRASEMGGGVQDPALWQQISSAVDEGRNLRIETITHARDGRQRWVDLDIQVLRDEQGIHQGFVAMARDITDARMAREREQAHAESLSAALRESEALMSTINAHAIVSEAGRDGRITRVNDAFCRISGYSAAELVGQDHRIINSGLQDRAFWQDMWQTLTRGRPWRGQICNRAKDGSLYWVDSIIAPFHDEQGRIQKYISIRFDITQARANEQALALERQRLRSTLEGTNVGTWEVNVITGENRIDERWAGMLGYALQELAPVTPQGWKSLVHPDDEKIAQSRLMDYLQGRTDIYEVERRLRHRNGHWIWVLSRGIVSSRLPDGQVEWMAGTHMDVTERHLLQEEVQRRNDLMSAIIENLPGGLSAFDADLGLILRNSKFGQLLQLPDALLSRQPATFESIIRFNAQRGEYGPGDPDAIVAAIVERARHPVPHVMERTRPDGSTLEVRGLPLPGGGFVSTYTDITERKQLERKLRASEEMLERAAQVAGVGSWSMDLRNKEVHWSQQTRRIHEVAPDFIPTLDNALAFYPPTAREEITRLVTRAIQAGEGFDTELPLITALGREIWVRSVGAAEFVDGEAARLIGAFQEITDRRLLEQRVRDQNRLLTAVLENMPGGLVAFDADLTLVMRNRQFGALLNFPESIFEQRPLRYETLIRNEAERGEFGPGDVDDIVAKAVSKLRQTRENIFERVRPNGQILEVRIQPMADGGVLFMLIDITRRKTAEREARQSDDMLRQAINTLDEAFVIYDEQDRLLICNQRYRDTYPVAAEVMKPGNTFEYIIRYGAERGEYAAATDRVDEWVAERLRQHRSGNTDVVQELGDGRFLRIVERRTAEGYTVGFRIDITDLIRARMAAEAASTSKSQFLANMSHEIRTPMNAILGMLNLLHKTSLNPRQLDYVNKTEGAARSLLDLLNDILDFSKVEAGKMTLESDTFDMDRLLRELSVILSSNTGDKDVEVLFDIDPRLPGLLIGDSLRLRQILINLGGNALKFTPRGMVVIRVAVHDIRAGAVTLAFSVQDTGIGIAPENVRRIFEGFSQAEASTTRRFGGTGLGLAISSRLVALMGGQLDLESTVGQGSRFFFNLTLGVHEAAKPLTEPAAHTGGRALRVLIVEDNAVARQTLHAMAGQLGWETELAISGSDALQRVAGRARAGLPTYDAFFVDWKLADMEGWEACLQIRQALGEQAASIHLLATAHARELLSNRPAQEQALVDGFLVKPITVSMLRDATLASPDAGASDAGPPEVAPTLRLQGLRLLVVEDNRINQQVAQELLEQEGAHVTLADNGLLGVQALIDQPAAFDLVLMDVQMPVLDGYAATRKIREELGLTQLPIIAMTANAMESDRADALACGMNAHVGKPFNLGALVATILQHVPARAELAPPANRTAGPAPTASLATLASTELDLEDALQRLGGNVNVLGRIIRAFAADLARQPADLAALLATGREDEARRLLHTLKGTAATVGARRLSRLAAEGEQQLMQAAPDRQAAELRALPARLKDVAEKTGEELKAALQLLLPPLQTGNEPATVLDVASLRRDLQALLPLLGSSDLASLDWYAQLRDRHGPMLNDELDDLDESMTQLDFEQAARQCLVLLQRYPLPTHAS